MGVEVEEIKKITDLVAGIKGQIPTPEAIQKIVNEIVEKRLGEVRRTHLEGADILKGSKFSAFGLKEEDIEFAWMVQKAAHDYRPTSYKGPSEALENAFKAVRTKANDAMDTAESGYGSQLVETAWVAELWAKARMANKIFPLFNVVQMSSGTVDLPIDGALPEMLYGGESTASNTSDLTTVNTASNKQTLTAKKLFVHQMWSGEMEEDSIIPYVSFLRGQLTKSVGYYMDSLLLNGDTETGGSNNINSDDGAPASTKHYLAFNGLRKLALVTNTANKSDVAAAITATKFLTAKSLMGVWGLPAVATDLVHIMDMSTYLTCLDLDELITNDKAGAQATILTGQLGAIFANPIIVSEAMSLTEADGKVNSAGSTAKGQICTVNRTAWQVGVRREGKLEFERIPKTDQSRLVFTTRVAFNYFDTDASAVLYDITI